MSISITDVVAITGQPGLFRLLKSNDNAIVVESLEAKPKRQLVKGNMMVSKLTDVSIYTEDDSEPLAEVLLKIKSEYGDELPITKKSSNTDLMEFLRKVLPDFDDERVYPSNVKKLVTWYNILIREKVDFTLPEEETEENTESPEENKPKAKKETESKSPAKTKAKKETVAKATAKVKAKKGAAPKVTAKPKAK